MRTKKLVMAAVAAILAILMMAELPIGVAAQTIEEKSPTQEATTETSSISDSEQEQELAHIVCEVESKRTQTEKHFRLSDGSFMAVQYEIPVHYKNNDGKWEEYDNSLQLTQSSIEDEPEEPTAALATSDELKSSSKSKKATEKEYKNRKSDIDIKISQKAKEKNMFKIKLDGNSISWGYKDVNKKSEAQVIEDKESLSGDESFYVKKNLNQEIIYKNIYQNVDLQCFVLPMGVKENLILNNKNVQTEYFTEYKIKGMTAVQKDSRNIELKNAEGKTVYNIAAPFMTDANEAVSEDVTLQIVENKNNKLTVKLTVDKQWLEDDERQFPITVDPQIFSSQEFDSVCSTYVDSANPNTNYGYSNGVVNCGTLYVGTYGDGKYRTLIKINSLPTLKNGDMVVNAKLNMHLYRASSNDTFYDDMYINAYTVQDSWNEGEVTWRTQPHYDSTSVEYLHMDENTEVGWKSWDITKSVKSWYSGSANYGLLLKPMDESQNLQCAGFYSGKYPEVSDARPCLLVTYRNNKGLENYWTYQSFSVGTAGTAYVNDYSGNLVFIENDVTTPSGKRAASIQHVYNGYMAGEQNSHIKPSVGKGWKLNVQQTLLPSSEYGLTGDAADMYPYVYMDEDGTEHYFYKEVKNGNTKYLDEDGLGLELKIEGSSSSKKYTISDDVNNRVQFNSIGVVIKTYNSNGNAMTPKYKDSTDSVEKRSITSVTDASGNVVAFNYGYKSYIDNLNDTANRQTKYSYTNGFLMNITKPTGKKITFTYDNDGALASVTDVDGYKVTFSYTSKASGKKVSAIQEYAADGTAGQKITFDRTKYNTTVIKSAGVDGNFGNDDDNISTYQFDNFGRTISVKNKTNQRDLGASVYTYTSGSMDSSASNIKKLNKISSEYSTGVSPENLINNSSFEDSGNWTKGKWDGSITFTNEYDTTEKYFGTKSMKVNTTAFEGNARGGAYQDLSTSIAKPGTTYTLSGYIKTKNITGNAQDSGAALCVETKTASGSQFHYSDFVIGNTSTDIDGGWRRVSVTFTVPSDAQKTRICLALCKTKGTAYFDGIQLEQYNVVNDYNLLSNSGFEKYDSNGMPSNWTGENLTVNSSNDWKSEAHCQGTYSFRIKGDPNTQKGMYQTVKVSGTENDTYILSGWAKAFAAPKYDNSTRRFKISIRVKYSDGTTNWKPALEFNHTINDWQFSSVAFNLSDGTSANKTPTEIGIYLRYQEQINNAYFDNLCLIKDNAQSYTYNDDGKLVSVTSNAKKQATMEYTNGNLTKNIDAKGYAYKYDYYQDNNKRYLTKATSQNDVTYNYGYADSTNLGLATSLEVKGKNANSLKSEVSYNGKGYASNVKDQDGYQTTYSYNTSTGTLARSTDTKGNTTNYTYDEKTDQITSVSMGSGDDIVKTDYTYSADKTKLLSIAHNGTQYSFEYDKFGNRTNSLVGTQSLAQYNYGANNGLLNSSTYGTGQTVSYTYTAFGDIDTQKYNGTTAFKWKSDRAGNIVEEIDYVNQMVYNITYDTTGRLVRKTARDRSTSSANKLLYALEYGYDLNNNITRLANVTPSRSVLTKYSYGKDNLLTKLTLSTNKNVTYTYDGLNRLTNTSLSTQTPVTTAYTYCNSARSNSDTTYTTTKIDEETIGGVTYKYTYDKLGNITQIRQKNGDTYTNLYAYEYDRLNQLVLEKDFTNGVQYTYEYDNSGNILNKKEYNLSQDGNQATLSDTVSYGYSDTNWKDKLTSFDGQTITYDEIGNPLSYRDGMTLTWKNGRQLTTLTQGTNSISYKYDSNSVRTSKTVNGVKYTYEYLSGMLLSETRGDARFYYEYDANGTLYAVTYIASSSATPVTYYYLHNSRGDIESIYNSNGELIASYKYDSWGKVLSVKDANGNAITDQSHIANLNPFRYRSYYYDTETGLYYLMSRYYDPETGRFINADGYISTGTGLLDTNMFAYCGNNPINFADATGEKTSIEIQKSVLNHGSGYTIMDATRAQKKEYLSSGVKNEKERSNGNSNTGTPNSKKNFYNSDGTKKQERWYGPDGFPIRDRDYNHPGDMEFPHDHEWINGERSKEHLEPSPEYQTSVDWDVVGMRLIGGIFIVAGIAYCFYTGDPSIIQQGVNACN